MLDHELLAESDESNLSLLLKTLQHRVVLFHHVEVMLGIENVELEDINAVDTQTGEAVFDGLSDIFGCSHHTGPVQIPALGGQNI